MVHGIDRCPSIWTIILLKSNTVVKYSELRISSIQLSNVNSRWMNIHKTGRDDRKRDASQKQKRYSVNNATSK